MLSRTISINAASAPPWTASNRRKRCIHMTCQTDHGQKLEQTYLAAMTSITSSQWIFTKGFWEVDALPDTTLHTVINKLKAHFARYGIPDVCISDNGPQFSLEEFKAFGLKWQFENKTSSPGYPQSNGKAEQAVKVAKALVKKVKKTCTDPYLSLLSHRNTPTQGLGSMSKSTKTLLPTTMNLLKPKLCMNIDKKLFAGKQEQARYHNKAA